MKQSVIKVGDIHYSLYNFKHPKGNEMIEEKETIITESKPINTTQMVKYVPTTYVTKSFNEMRIANTEQKYKICRCEKCGGLKT